MLEMTEASQERAIGRIEGKLDLIIAEQQDAANSRRVTYEKLDQINRKSDATDRNVDELHKRMATIEVPVAEFSRWRERFIGMGLLVALTAGLIGAIAGALWQKIVALFN
ncbi:hypothetical protein [Candidatus Phyllobacterium onerii]|uniref:hypothetical protein n=1 Tax=Candidatus Phyllobacterium onerii TaxID=3020828 RepID=UPI002330C112|nr:hypothetical protein [Phyllobacterium sp. IY22]